MNECIGRERSDFSLARFGLWREKRSSSSTCTATCGPGQRCRCCLRTRCPPGWSSGTGWFEGQPLECCFSQWRRWLELKSADAQMRIIKKTNQKSTLKKRRRNRNVNGYHHPPVGTLDDGSHRLHQRSEEGHGGDIQSIFLLLFIIRMVSLVVAVLQDAFKQAVDDGRVDGLVLLHLLHLLLLLRAFSTLRLFDVTQHLQWTRCWRWRWDQQPLTCTYTYTYKINI